MTLKLYQDLDYSSSVMQSRFIEVYNEDAGPIKYPLPHMNLLIYTLEHMVAAGKLSLEYSV